MCRYNVCSLELHVIHHKKKLELRDLTAVCFSVIFTKRNKFLDFYLASAGDKPSPEGLLLKKITCSWEKFFPLEIYTINKGGENEKGKILLK